MPAAARRCGAWRWLVVMSSAKQKQQLHHQQLTNGNTILKTFTCPEFLDLFKFIYKSLSYWIILANNRPTTPWTAIRMTAMVSPLRQQQVSPLSPRSPTRSLGAIRAWLLCSTCLRLMRRARRQLVSLRSARSAIMTTVTVPTVNRKLGTMTRGAV